MEIAHNNKDAELLIDPSSGTIIDANEQTESFLEMRYKELIGLKIDKILFKEQDKKSKRFLKKIQKKKDQTIYFIITNDKGDIRHLGIKASNFQSNNKNLLKCTLHEASQKVRLDDFLLDISSNYRSIEDIINQGPLVIFLCLNKKKWPIIFISDNIKRYGYKKENFKYGRLNLKDLLHPDDIDDFFFHKKSSTSQINNDFKKKCRILTKTGDVKWVNIHSWTRKSLNDTFTFRLGIILDITKQKKAEEARKQSEDRYRELISSANSIILKWGINGKINFINEFGLNFFGYTTSEILYQPIIGTIIPQTEISKRTLELLIENICQDPENYKNNELESINKNGKKVWISWSNKAIKDEQGNLIEILSIGNDITERKNAEDKLKESEIKYRLAYNKAEFYKDLFVHDMSNILHNILSSVELYSLCQRFPEKLENGEDLLKIIEDQANRGAELITNVHNLSKMEEENFPTQEVEILTYLKEAFKFVENSFPGKIININLDNTFEEYYVLANELILDVFENILINAVEHNNNEAQIQVKISNELKDEISYIKIQFIDNGVGIPEERKKTVFQRNFNKGNSGKGMGIGLSLVKSIINSFNGYIFVENKINGDYSKGSNFIIYIPEAK